jgi:hypothetical protein
VTTTHSRIGRPLPLSNGLPPPEPTSASTRRAGSFSTRSPFTTIAKIDPSTFSASAPKPRPPD